MASGAVVGVAAVAIAGLAFAYEGNPTTEVELHDGGVWLTNTSQLAVGHFNNESRQLDGMTHTTSDAFDVRQQGETVLVVDSTSSTAAALDPASMTMSSPTQLSSGAIVELGGPTTAVLDPDSGDLWVMPTETLGGFDPKETDPVAEIGEGADVTVTLEGTVFAVSPERGVIVEVPVEPDGNPQDPRERPLEGLKAQADVDIAAVGDVPVVLNRTSGVVASPDGLHYELEGAQAAQAKLQQTSPEALDVHVATGRELLRIPLSSGEAVAVPSGAGEGIPAQPVWVAGCAYAAWAGSAAFVRDCAGEQDDLQREVPNGAEATELVFRVNRDVVVLNDVASGMAWMAMDQLQRVDNWDELTPPEGEENEEEDDSTDETIETVLPERTEENTVPIAVDDEYGVRAGRTTVLPVLDNDSDADGDILTITLPDGGPSLGDVQPIRNGAALQISVPASASGGASFMYQIDDGRGGTATASVQLEVRPDSANEPPELKRPGAQTVVPVEVGGTVTYNVLPDWIDPDGDDIYLARVQAHTGDEADFTPDGRITYRATSGARGPLEVPIVLSDGRAESAGTLKLDVRPVGSTKPITNADHIVVRAGETATVAPLANDINASPEPLRLTRVGEVPGAEIVPDFADKTFTFRSTTLGTSYVEYLAASGPNAAGGIVRVDVIPDEESDLPPIAVRDVVMLPAGGEALVNVLDNDTDPSGGILVVQSVALDESQGLSVSVLGHETLRIGDRGTQVDQATLTYRMSNGRQSVTGEVVVIPIPAPDKLRPPVANDDEAVVRAGDVVDIDVLDNDYHPNDDVMHVEPELVEAPSPEAGDIFVSQDLVRFRASDEPGTVYATYEVRDSTGQKDAGFITIQVLPVDEEHNQAPRPRDIEARALAGSDTQIPIPLSGLDADGDSVELVGIDSAPSQGAIVETEKDHFVYRASEEAGGVDSFTYRVRDRLGAEATASVRVGIAPADSANQPPYAVKDSLVVRPGREVAVPVLANDSDPEGDQIGLVSDGLIMPEGVPGLDAEVLGDRVIVTAPDQEMETSLQYTIADERDGRATAVLQITVDEDVPLQRPIARDDAVLIDDISEELTADVEVLANDEDPDGTVQALELTTDGGEVVDDGIIRVDITDERRIVTYTITDEDGQAASAFIHVPSTEDLRPTLKTTGIEVRSGETIDIPLSEHVTVLGGGSVVITEAEKVSALHSNGDPLVKDERTLVYTSADRYYGQDAVTFEVTDGAGPDDPEGRKATLTLPITVLPPDNMPPTFANTSMQVGAGDDPQRKDLVSLTDDPDEGDLDGMSYRIVEGGGAGLDASIDGQSLVVSADPDLKGETIDLVIAADDGTNEPVEGTVAVTVTASSRALPVANTDVEESANQGETYRFDVLANDFNPFPEEPLRVTLAAVESGTGSVEFDESTVSVTPGADYVGRMRVAYRIQDATNDPDREVEGQIDLIVRGAPDAPPGTPTSSGEMDRKAVLSWSTPADNGAPITGYTVRSVSGPSYEKECPSTTCTLEGLTNNVEYRFVVTAHNEVGEGEPSLPSEVIRPDVVPEAPAAPTLEFRDSALLIEWATPHSAGSPVDGYTIGISPAPNSAPSGEKRVGAVNSYLFEGLQNGTNYTITIKAHNQSRTGRTEGSAWSPGASETPAAPPDAPAKPTMGPAQPVGDRNQITVSWQAPNNNGDSIDEYILRVQGGQNLTHRVPGGQTSFTIQAPVSTSGYQVNVTAVNKAGAGAASPWSDPRRSVRPPGAPSNVQASVNGTSGQASVSWAAATQLNGAAAGEISYRVSGGGKSQVVRGTSASFSGLANSATTFSVQTIATVEGQQYAGGSAQSNSVTPYGPPHAPSVGSSVNGNVITLTANAGGTQNGTGRAVTAMEVDWPGGGTQTYRGANAQDIGQKTWSQDVGYSKERCVRARVQNSEGQWSSWSGTSCKTTGPQPQPRAWVTKSDNVAPCGQHCRYLVVNTQNFPGGTRSITCMSDSGQIGSATYSADLGGSKRVQLGCYFGYRENVWVNISGYGQSEKINWSW